MRILATLGLLNIAKRCIIKSDENPNPKYNFIDGDEVWIVLDIDKDKNELDNLKSKVSRENVMVF